MVAQTVEKLTSFLSDISFFIFYKIIIEFLKEMVYNRFNGFYAKERYF